jgi:hypothetical protein
LVHESLLNLHSKVYEALGPVSMPFYSVPLPKDPTAEQNPKGNQKKTTTETQVKPVEPAGGQDPSEADKKLDKTDSEDVEMEPKEGVAEEKKQEGEKPLEEVEEGELSADPTEDPQTLPTQPPEQEQQESRVSKYLREERELYEKLLASRQLVFQELRIGDHVFVLEGHYRVVDPRVIYTPGCDASAANDHELPEEVNTIKCPHPPPLLSSSHYILSFVLSLIRDPILVPYPILCPPVLRPIYRMSSSSGLILMRSIFIFVLGARIFR